MLGIVDRAIDVNCKMHVIRDTGKSPVRGSDYHQPCSCSTVPITNN